jgi:N-acetylglutamate synthase-like GNAT family acetyltransferase
MNIRKGTEEDIPLIIELLKVSLGESLIPKSVDLWRWKHVVNPFGLSPVLVAEEGGLLVGVRAFLKWQWVLGGQKLTAIRAVDTATHPEHQGKGIFKKLTLQGVAEAKAEGIRFVFNTPNESSKPGYLKMGWVSAGRIPLKLNVHPFAYKRFVPPAVPEQDWDKLALLLLQVENPLGHHPHLRTAISPEYLVWRYKANPLFRYEYLSDYKSYILFFRIKAHNFGLELRVVDFFVNPRAFEAAAQAHLNTAFRKIAKACFLVSTSANHYRLGKKHYPGMGILPVVDKGPILTLRNLTMGEKDFESLSEMRKLGFSLGDMELF